MTTAVPSRCPAALRGARRRNGFDDLVDAAGKALALLGEAAYTEAYERGAALDMARPRSAD